MSCDGTHPSFLGACLLSFSVSSFSFSLLGGRETRACAVRSPRPGSLRRLFSPLAKQRASRAAAALLLLLRPPQKTTSSTVRLRYCYSFCRPAPVRTRTNVRTCRVMIQAVHTHFTQLLLRERRCAIGAPRSESRREKRKARRSARFISPNFTATKLRSRTGRSERDKNRL